MRILFFLLISLMMLSCEKVDVKKIMPADQRVTVLIQPFQDMRSADVSAIAAQVKKFCPNVRILEPVSFPANANYKPRNRYRADSIIRHFQSTAGRNTVILALTGKDISATKGKNPDFGLMGLAFIPGKACVASSFRLKKNKKNEQHFKVAIHELGHTQGLPHCPEKTCFMRDAEGGNPTDEETDFCVKCKSHLKNKNWNFN